MKERVITGLESFLRTEGRRYRSARLGIVAHQASVTAELRHAVDALIDGGWDLRAIFAPEHGLAGTEQDLRAVGSERRRGRPVHSLYGERLAPHRRALASLDALLFDLQDVGSRYYTYISTMLHACRACAEAGVELVVLDRPNPIGGTEMEGNLVEPTHLSFVGVHPLPARHGMTVGEVARMFHRELSIDSRLTIVPLKEWTRAMWFDETGLPWVLPSPNMPTLETAAVYPGQCLLEGTNLSEGRGTTRPFEIFGAPWLDTRRLGRFLRDRRLPGVYFRETRFKPTFNKHGGTVCKGFQVHVLDRERFKPYLTGIAVVQGSLAIHRKQFAWRDPPYEYELSRLPIDILLGSTRLRQMIENEAPLKAIERSWQAEQRGFARRRGEFLLYE